MPIEDILQSSIFYIQTRHQKFLSCPDHAIVYHKPFFFYSRHFNLSQQETHRWNRFTDKLQLAHIKGMRPFFLCHQLHLYFSALTSQDVSLKKRSTEKGSVPYLVKSRKDVVSKLYLSDGCGTSSSYTNTKSHNPLLTKGSVEDSVLTWGEIKIRKLEY